jgi:hypothetical protein
MAKAANFRANNNAQGHGNRVRALTLHDTSRGWREPPKTLLSLLGSHRGQVPRVVATTLVGRFVDQRVWRDGASPAQVGPPVWRWVRVCY